MMRAIILIVLALYLSYVPAQDGAKSSFGTETASYINTSAVLVVMGLSYSIGSGNRLKYQMALRKKYEREKVL